MAQQDFARGRRVAVGGLLLQFLAFMVLLLTSFAAGNAPDPAENLAAAPYSRSLFHLAIFVGVGVVLWLALALVFRQRELAAAERLDVEELLREKQSAGAGAALFDEQSSGFHVAANRLAWMERYLLPTFGLVLGVALAGGGVGLWYLLAGPAGLSVSSDALVAAQWGRPSTPAISMIVVSIATLVLFLYSRWAAGLARAADQQLLRAAASYLMGNVLAAAAVVIALGIQLYAGSTYWEHVLAFAIPGLMVLLGAEILLNVVFDVYRPRSPQVEPRAAFDSRLLGLFSEPGGIAHSIAEAVNYQFGFRVSQTWFYQLVQRTAAPLLALGAAMLWMLTTVVVIQPNEHVIVERFGRQLNADRPLGPGLHWKLPWPIDVARVYDTGRVQQMYIGFTDFDAEPDFEERTRADVVSLWTDEQHLGHEHFDFLIVPPVDEENPTPPRRATELDGLAALTEVDGGAAVDVPVSLIRMDVIVQYRIDPNAVAQYARLTDSPVSLLRSLAWREVVKFNASQTVDGLLGEARRALDEALQERVEKAVATAGPDGGGLGLEIVYVGVENVHPEKTVAEAFRNVVKAEQEKVASIREALVTENERLATVAGDRGRAQQLAAAVRGAISAENALNLAEAQLSPRLSEDEIASYDERFETFAPQFLALEQARWALAQTERLRDRSEMQFGLGMRFTANDRAVIDEQVVAAERRVEEAEEQLSDSLLEVRSALRDEQLSDDEIDALVARATARTALTFWRAKTQSLEQELQGQAAVLLAEARAERWEREMRAAAQVTQLRLELEAYRAAPAIYRTRRYLTELVNGIRQDRKYFMAFPSERRPVHIRYQAEEQARPEDVEMQVRRDEP